MQQKTLKKICFMNLIFWLLFKPKYYKLNFDLSLNRTVFSCRVQPIADRISSPAGRINDILTFTASVDHEKHEKIYLEMLSFNKYC